MPPKQKEKIEAEIRKLAKLEGNKTCADCTEKMPSYVNLTHKTFVCTKCSGIHRELQYKVKGISMSEFTQQEVSDLTSGGNVFHNSKFLARHAARDFPIPTGSDVPKLREFIRLKYVDKKWYSDDNRVEESPPSVVSLPSQTHVAVSSTAFKLVSKPVASNGLDLLDLMDSTPAAAPQSSFDAFSVNTAVPVKPISQSTFDAFSGSSAAPVNPAVFNDFFPNPTPPSTPATATTQGQFSFSDFPAPPTSTFMTAFPPAAPVANINTTAQMNFIQLNPPAANTAPAAAAAPPVPVVKNFSAFDDITPVAPLQHPSAQAPQSNPFDNRPRPGPPGNPFGQPGVLPYPQQGFPSQYAPPTAHYAYPGQQTPQHYGVPPHGFPGYPPVQQAYPVQGYPPQQGFPPGAYSQPPPATAPTTDPFATVGGLKWGATGGPAPPAPVPAPASTNPFDLF